MERVVRVLVYEGDAEWIAQTMAKNAVQGVRQVSEVNRIASYVLTPGVDSVKRLMDAMEGECDGMSVDADTARRILEHVFVNLPR